MQDDWKPNDKLTLNLGLRYDFMPPATEKDNRMANFDPTANGGAGGLVFAKDGSLADRALVNPDKNNFAPRLGAIYRFNDKTLLRGGYGVFYNQFDRIGSEDQLALNPPGLRNIQVNSASGATTPVLLHERRLPGQLSRSVEPRHPQPEAARRRPGRAAHAWCSSSAAASSGRSAPTSWCRPTRSARSRSTSPCCAISINRCPARSTPTARCRSRTSATSRRAR